MLAAAVTVVSGVVPARADTLEWALVQAYQNNPSLNAQRAALRAVDENVPQALSGYRPRLSATASGGFNYFNQVNKSVNQQVFPNQPIYTSIGEDLGTRQFGATATQTLFNGFQTANRTLAVLTNDVAHLIGIADCRIIVEEERGDVNDFNPSDLEKIESLIINERRRLEATYPDEDLWPRLQPFIRSFRELANLQLGYSVVHPTRSWCTRTKRLTREAGELRHLMVVSDGLYRLVNIFHVTNAEGLLRRALQEGLEVLCSELREMELKDPRCIVYPRVKTCDDASGILLRIL